MEIFVPMMGPSLRYSTIVKLVIQQSKQHANKTAFRFFTDENSITTKITYQQLLEKIIQLATHLQKLIEPGDRVILILSPDENYVIALLACFFAGAVAVPIYPPDIHNLDLSLEIFKTVTADSQAKLVLTSVEIHGIYENLLKPQNVNNKVMWLNIDSNFSANSENWIEPPLQADSLAILLYTSGSTGQPKGVMLSHQNLIHDASIMSQHCKITDNDIFGIWLPPYHVSGIFSGIILPLYAGSETILFSPQQFLEKPQRWVDIISTYRVTMSGAPTFAYNICASSVEKEKIKNLDLSCWRVAVIGGEAIHQEVIEKFTNKFAEYGFSGKTFFSMYGLTESTMISTGSELGVKPKGLWIQRDGLEQHQACLAQTPNESAVYFVNSGKALHSMTLKIVNPNTLVECKEQEIGEIWLTGGSVAQGYWNKPEATQYAFQALTHNSEGPFLRTGDLGFLYNNNLYVTGRLKEMIIIRGINYYPNDIEFSALQSHTNISRATCAAFALEINNEEKLILTLELDPSISSTEKEIIFKQIRSNVARRHGVQVYGVVFLEKNSTPRTNTGKVQRNACKAKVASGEWKIFQSDFLHQVTDDSTKEVDIQVTKEKLMEMSSHQAKIKLHKLLQSEFNKLCGLINNAISIDIPIASFGMDSVMMVKFITKLRGHYDVEIPINCFYDDTTIAMLADNIWAQLTKHEMDITDCNKTDFKQEINLAELIKTELASLPNTANQNSAILLTGATGFLGAYLLHDLLSNTTADIYCLVRADSKEQAKQRIITNFNKRFQWREAFNHRIHVILGELNKPQLGIEPADYIFLARHIGKIYHNGASVNFVAPYQSLKSTNVTSVVEVIKLAAHTTLKSIHFISTLGVFNSKDRGYYSELKETDRLLSSENIFGGYAQTKWVAEELLSQAKQFGIPVSIYRPGLITGDSGNGHMNTEDFLCRFLKGCIQLKAFPNLNIDIDMTPVNYVSAAVTYLSQDNKNLNNVYHLTCPESISLPNFVSWIKGYGYDVKLVSYQAWLNMIFNASINNSLYTLIPFLTSRLTTHKITFLELFALEHNPVFSQINTQAALRNSQIQCAEIDSQLLRTYFDYFITQNFLKQPKELIYDSIGT